MANEQHAITPREPAATIAADVQSLNHVVRPRVAIVSDVRMYLDGLATQIGTREEFHVVARIESSAAVDSAVDEVHADIVLFDISFPGGLHRARQLAEGYPETSVIVFAVSDTDVPACAEAGVAAFLTREASVEDLVAVVRGVARGEIVCSPRAAAALYRRVASLRAAPAPTFAVALTAREREVVRLIDRGMSNKDIARALGIGLATAKNHVHHILEKLRVGDRHEVAEWARHGGARNSRTLGPSADR